MKSWLMIFISLALGFAAVSPVAPPCSTGTTIDAPAFAQAAMAARLATFHPWFVKGYWQMAREPVDAVDRIDNGQTNSPSAAPPVQHVVTRGGAKEEPAPTLPNTVFIFSMAGDYRPEMMEDVQRHYPNDVDAVRGVVEAERARLVPQLRQREEFSDLDDLFWTSTLGEYLNAFVHQVVLWRVLIAKGYRPRHIVGLGAGYYAALYAAGVASLSQVTQRAIWNIAVVQALSDIYDRRQTTVVFGADLRLLNPALGQNKGMLTVYVGSGVQVISAPQEELPLIMESVEMSGFSSRGLAARHDGYFEPKQGMPGRAIQLWKAYRGFLRTVQASSHMPDNIYFYSTTNVGQLIKDAIDAALEEVRLIYQMIHFKNVLELLRHRRVIEFVQLGAWPQVLELLHGKGKLLPPSATRISPIVNTSDIQQFVVDQSPGADDNLDSGEDPKTWELKDRVRMVGGGSPMQGREGIIVGMPGSPSGDVSEFVVQFPPIMSADTTIARQEEIRISLAAASRSLRLVGRGHTYRMKKKKREQQWVSHSA